MKAFRWERLGGFGASTVNFPRRTLFEPSGENRNEGQTIPTGATTMSNETAKGEEMATQRAIDEADIRRRIDKLADAISTMDLEIVMSFYARDMVSFDIVPPLRNVGVEAKRRQWVEAFATYRPPLGYEFRNLAITVGDDVAFAHSLNRMSGTLKNGRQMDFWLRWTACFRKADGSWLIAHDHVSVPVDHANGKALLDLEP